jgi:hypothetical protein
MSVASPFLDLIPAMVRDQGDLFAKLIDSKQKCGRIKHGSSVNYLHSFGYVISPGETDKILDPVFGQIKLHSNFVLTLDLYSEEDHISVGVRLELAHERYGVEARQVLPILGDIAHIQESFTHEARRWHIKHEGILVGESVIRQFRAVLDDLKPEYKSKIRDANA